MNQFSCRTLIRTFGTTQSIESTVDSRRFLSSRMKSKQIPEIESDAQKTKTVDSGIDSLEHSSHPANEDAKNPRNLSSGNDQIDLALIQHLIYCDTLLESLGGCGPLKHNENRALRHLLAQADILETLGRLVENPVMMEDFTTLMRDITEKQRLHLLWEQCAGGHYLNTSADSVVTQLKARYVHFFKVFSGSERQDVLELLICQMLDRPAYDPSAIVTLFHFLTFLKNDNHWDVEALLLKFHKDLKVLGSLQSKNLKEIVDTLHSLRGRPVDAAYAVQVAVCLLNDDISVQAAARDFLVTSCKDESLRSWMLRTYATALEDERVEIRRAACRALSVLEALECTQELVHVIEFDASPLVKSEAKEALSTFGSEGQSVSGDFLPNHNGYDSTFTMRV